MEPIVSPWFIYVIGIADGFIASMGFVGFWFSLACVIAFGCIVTNISEADNPNASKTSRPWQLSIPVLLFLLWWLVFALVPNSKTLIGMAVAQNVTQDRVVRAGKVVYAAKDDLKKDIIDIITALKKEGPAAVSKK